MSTVTERRGPSAPASATRFTDHVAAERRARRLRRVVTLGGLGGVVYAAWGPVAKLADALGTLGGAL